MVPLAEALAIVLRESTLLPTEEVSLEEALGRVLREDIRADADQPPFDRAAMDGYAVRAEDAAKAPVRLRVAGEVKAGQWPQHAVGPGEAVRVMTGAPVPPGATAVQQVEKTRLFEDGVEILVAVEKGEHVAPRGSTARAGEVVLASGRVIDPAAIAVLASVGRTHPTVGRRPTIALLATGDELVGVGESPGPGQVRNSNAPALAAQARLAGAAVRSLGMSVDREDVIARAVEGAAGADVLVVSGGVSVGKYDLVEPVLEKAGFAFLFTAVAIKPGAPLVFGRRERTLVFGLPGNPVSAQVTFDLFVRPCLLCMQGARSVSLPRVTARLASRAQNRSGRTNHLPARIVWRDGGFEAQLVRSAGSGDLVAHAQANALVVIEAGRRDVAAGETAEAVILTSFLEDDGAPR